MWLDWVSNLGPLAVESDALQAALCTLAYKHLDLTVIKASQLCKKFLCYCTRLSRLLAIVCNADLCNHCEVIITVIVVIIYSLTCIKQAPKGESKSACLRQVIA